MITGNQRRRGQMQANERVATGLIRGIALVVAVSMLLSACASVTKLDGALSSRAASLEKQGDELSSSGKHDEAREAYVAATSSLTDGGKLSGGQHEAYVMEARLLSKTAAAAFEGLKISEATQLWHSSVVTLYKGVSNEQRVKDSNKSTANNIFAALAVGLTVIGSTKASSDKRVTSAALRQANSDAIIQNGLNMLNMLDFNPAAPVNPALQNAGMFEGHVVRVAATTDAGIFRTVGRVTNGSGHCTGTWVGRYTVLTNAHCVTNDNGAPISPPLIEFHREFTDRTLTYSAREYHTHKGKNAGWDQSHSTDWAIIVLDSRSDDPIAELAGTRTPANVFSGKQPLMQAGYSGDLNGGKYLTLHFNCRGTKSPGGNVYTNCDGAGGSSGSAIFTASKPHRIVALHRGRYVNQSANQKHPSIEVDLSGFAAKLKEINAANS